MKEFMFVWNGSKIAMQFHQKDDLPVLINGKQFGTSAKYKYSVYLAVKKWCLSQVQGMVLDAVDSITPINREMGK